MYICPVCKKPLKLFEKSFHCRNGHSFDIAKKGYVNLMTTVKHNPKNAGDNPQMVKARTDFLDTDSYLPLAKKLGEILDSNLKGVKAPIVIDSGCGEGFYTVNCGKALPNVKFFGIDISKTAVSHCMTRVHLNGLENCEFAVASSFHLPFGDSSAEAVVSVFAPVANDEYARVLKNGGKLFVVSPTPLHLFEMKEILYENPYENKPNVYGLNKFQLCDSQTLEYKITLENNQDIFNLFTMTPYYYKTPQQAVEKLQSVENLEITCGFLIQTYTKK